MKNVLKLNQPVLDSIIESTSFKTLEKLNSLQLLDSPYYQKIIESKLNYIKLLTDNYSQGVIYEILDNSLLLKCKTIYDYSFYPILFEITEIHPEIEVLWIEYIDRGVEDWDIFGTWITTKFPNLSVFIMAQNYSHNCNVISFINFIKTTKLKLFVLKDYQTREFRGEDFYNQWADNIQKGSKHILLKDCCFDRNDGEIVKYKNKLFVKGRLN